MSTTANTLLLPVPGRGLVPLDLLADAAPLLPTFQANDRTKPDSIQSDYSHEFEVPGTAHNHTLLRHAAASQPVPGAAYLRLSAVLVSGGVEILPKAILLIKAYTEGKYQLQLLGGNRRFVESLLRPDGSDKTLADLDFTRFNHLWTPANILPRLPYAYWQQQGWGYELFDRGKPIDFGAVDPYTLYPSVSYRLVLQQLLADAGFTATDLLATEPLLQQLNVPTPNPYVFPEKFRNARKLLAAYVYDPAVGAPHPGLFKTAPFDWQQLVFPYAGRSPYHVPEPATGGTYAGGTCTIGTLGYYDLTGSAAVNFGSAQQFGDVRCKIQLRVNGQTVYDEFGSPGSDEKEGDELPGQYAAHTFTAKLRHVLLQPGDTVSLWWRGDGISRGGLAPVEPQWKLGPVGPQLPLADGRRVATQSTLTVELLEEFPPGGLVKLNEWLPEMKQLDFFKSLMLLLGLTVQADAYRDHLHLSPGNRLLSAADVASAQDWTRKRDAYAPPGRLPERNLTFRFGSYGQVNTLAWEADDRVTEGYGNGTIAVADQVLPATYELAKLPFAATQGSDTTQGLLAITNFEPQDLTATPVVYNKVEAKPRLVLRSADQQVSGALVMGGGQPADFTTTASYFVGVGLSLELDETVLGSYWQDLRAMLDESRYLTERYRLTPEDISTLNYAVPIWDGLLGDYFAVSQVSEYDARRPVEVTLCRLNAKYLPPPVVPGGQMSEWYEGEWFNAEWY